MTCLLLGPTGAGKTLLLKHLQSLASSTPTTTATSAGPNGVTKPSSAEQIATLATIPTVGSNIATITFAKKHTLTVKEVGGAMAPTWHQYYADACGFVLVMDSSNPMQLAAAYSALMDLVSARPTQRKPVLVVLNQRDSANAMRVDEVKRAVPLDEVVAHATQPMLVVEASAKRGDGVDLVLRWLRDLAGPA